MARAYWRDIARRCDQSHDYRRGWWQPKGSVVRRYNHVSNDMIWVDMGCKSFLFASCVLSFYNTSYGLLNLETRAMESCSCKVYSPFFNISGYDQIEIWTPFECLFFMFLRWLLHETKRQQCNLMQITRWSQAFRFIKWSKLWPYSIQITPYFYVISQHILVLNA